VTPNRRTTNTTSTPTENNGRLVPHDAEAERQLLGTAALKPDAARLLTEQLNPEDFYVIAHQHVAAVITDLHRAGTPIDYVTISDELSRRGLLDQAGGQAEIVALPLGAVSAAPEWVRIIKQAATRRRLIALAGDLTAAAYNGTDPDPALARLADLTFGDDDVSYIDRLRNQLLVGDAIKNLPPAKPLIEGLLDLDSIAALYGRSGAGKSFVAIDWALSVSTGSWWFGHAVSPGRVLYVVAEGATGVPQRVDAWQHARQTWSIGDIMWLPAPVDIFQAERAGDVTRLLRQLAPQFIILDTLARSVPAADENSARDMSLVILHADRLRRATGACVLIVHHTGRDEARGMRGSTVLEAAMDTVLECRKNEDGALDITAMKHKNRPSGQKIRLALANQNDSCVLAPWRGQDIDGLTATAETVLSTLHEIDLGDGVSQAAWMNSSDLPERTFRRWVRKVVDLGLVDTEGNTVRKRFSINDAGLEALGLKERPTDF
jgi:hypothetical protein